MKRAFKQTYAFVKQPVFILALLTILVLAAWQTYATRVRAVETPAGNLLTNPSFEDLDSRGLPAQWAVAREAGSPGLEMAARGGYDGKYSLHVGALQYDKGMVGIVSPKVQVEPGKTYLFQARYFGDAGFDLVAYFYGQDGAQRRLILQHYKASDKWTGLSDSVTVPAGVTAISFALHLSQKGFVDLDAASVIPTTAAQTAPVCPAGQNLIPNGDLSLLRGVWPQAWEPFQYGDNKAVNQLVGNKGNIYAQSEVTIYKNGVAKWVHAPVALSQGTRYCVGLDYQATVSADVMAQYTLSDGSVQYKYLATIRPTGEWTTIVMSAEAPAKTVKVMVAVELTSAGVVETDNYQLVVINQ
jgi:hypothetical protein